jgi:hypothetical protein
VVVVGGLSRKPAARARQLANLKRGDNPAAAGNRHRVTHGAYARVAADRLDRKAREVFDALAADAPLREDGELPAADGAAVRLAADVLCRLDDLSGWLRDHGWLDAGGQPREGLLDLERRLRAEAADHLDALGCTPRSRARLGLDVARAAGFDLAQRWADAADTIDGEEAAGA